MSAVRVHLIIDGVRLEFLGDEALFQRCVAPLVDAAYRRAAGLPTAPAALEAQAAAIPDVDAPTPPDPAPPAEPAGGSDVGSAQRAGSGVEAEDPDGFVPQSGQFSAFLRKVGARAANPEQQVVAFAFYLWNYEDRRRFEKRELEGCFGAIGMEAPQGLEGCLADLCQRKRFLARVGGNGQLELTPKGVNYVKTRLLADL